MRATWVTDVHLNFLGPVQRAQFVARIADDAPDVVLVTGDTGESGDVLGYLAELDRVAPAYFVLGNHDFYRASIAGVRALARATGRWLPAAGPIWLSDATVLVGIDGWGDARCGNLGSKVALADWRLIEELRGLVTAERIAALQALGAREADALRDQLARLGPARAVVVLTHVPPFAEACWYDGQPSSPEWLPWFTCIAVGEVLRAYARAHPATAITVLCGHTHGRGEYRAEDNLVVRTGGWPVGERDYGNPIVQATWSLA